MGRPIALRSFSSCLLTPVILSQPGALVIGAGSNATFKVTAAGPNLVYAWSKGAAPLMQGGRISGSAWASLTIAGVTDCGCRGLLVPDHQRQWVDQHGCRGPYGS